MPQTPAFMGCAVAVFVGCVKREPVAAIVFLHDEPTRAVAHPEPTRPVGFCEMGREAVAFACAHWSSGAGSSTHSPARRVQTRPLVSKAYTKGSNFVALVAIWTNVTFTWSSAASA